MIVRDLSIKHVRINSAYRERPDKNADDLRGCCSVESKLLQQGFAPLKYEVGIDLCHPASTLFDTHS